MSFALDKPAKAHTLHPAADEESSGFGRFVSRCHSWL
jgi:hypothetical protein